MRYVLAILLAAIPGIAGAAAPNDGLTATNKALAAHYWQASNDCRGGHGNELSTFIACIDRDAYRALLSGRGYCQGDDGAWKDCRSSHARP